MSSWVAEPPAPLFVLQITAALLLQPLKAELLLAGRFLGGSLGACRNPTPAAWLSRKSAGASESQSADNWGCPPGHVAKHLAF